MCLEQVFPELLCPQLLASQNEPVHHLSLVSGPALPLLHGFRPKFRSPGSCLRANVFTTHVYTVCIAGVSEVRFLRCNVTLCFNLKLLNILSLLYPVCASYAFTGHVPLRTAWSQDFPHSNRGSQAGVATAAGASTATTHLHGSSSAYGLDNSAHAPLSQQQQQQHQRLSQSGVEVGHRASIGDSFNTATSAPGSVPSAGNGGYASAGLGKRGGTGSGSASGQLLLGGDFAGQGTIKGGASSGGGSGALRPIGGSSGNLSSPAAGVGAEGEMIRRARSSESGADPRGLNLPPTAAGGGGSTGQQHHWTPMGLLRHGSSGGISDPGIATASGTPVGHARYPQSAHSMQGDGGGYSPVRGGAGAFKNIWHKQSGRPPAGYMWVWLGRLRRWRRRWFVAHTPGGFGVLGVVAYTPGGFGLLGSGR